MTTNYDPDGLACYSDHAYDIRMRGACDLCGSTSADVIGVVMPDVDRVRDLDPVDAARRVVTEQSALIVDGVLLDHFTAAHIVAVYDALSTESARAKLRAMSLARAATVCFTLAANNRK